MRETKDRLCDRRTFVAGAGAAALGAGLVGCAAGSGEEDAPLAATAPEMAAYGPDEGEWIPTTCNMCFNNCSIKAHVVNGVVVELTGNEESPIGWGHVCAKGAAGIMQLYDPNRITRPLVRTNPKKGFDEDPGWKEISWDEAYDLLSTKVKDAIAENPQAVAHASMVANLSGSMLRATGLGSIFGVSVGGGASDICGAGVHETEYLLTGGGNAAPDYLYCDYLIQFGTQAGTATRHGFNMTAKRFAERRRAGLRLVSFDPHMSAGAEKADLWVPIRPGTDAAAALAMACVLVNELDLIDREYLAKRTNGPALVHPETGRVLRAADSNKALFWDEAEGAPKPYDECAAPVLEGIFEVDGLGCKTAFTTYKEHLAPMTPEWAEEITTVPAATLRQVAREFGEAARIGETIEIDGHTIPLRPAAVDVFSGLSRHKHSLLNVWACLSLNTLVGSANSAGGLIGFASACRGWADGNQNAAYRPGIWEEDGFIEGCNMQFGFPISFYRNIRENDYTPVDSGMLGLMPLGEDPHFYNIAQPHPERYGTTPSTVMFTYACNPLKWWGNKDEQAEVYKSYDYVIGCDLFLNDSSYFMDLILPEACYLERYEVMPHMFQNHRMPAGMDVPWTVNVAQPVVAPRDGELKGYFEIFFDLAHREGKTADLLAVLNTLYRVKEEYQVPADKKVDIEEFTDGVLKSNIDEEHGLAWFKENGVYTYPRKVDEIYLWADDNPGRIPLYWDFMFEAKQKVEAKVAELGIPWETDDYLPMPEWRPDTEFSVDDSSFDMFPVYYTNAANTDSWTVENPWLDEVNEDDGVTYCIEMNTATAASKGLASGDVVRLTSTPGYTVEGRLVVTDGIHPECVSSVVGTWNAQSKFMPVAQGKGVNLVNLVPGQDPKRMDHVVAAFDQLVRVKIEKIA